MLRFQWQRLFRTQNNLMLPVHSHWLSKLFEWRECVHMKSVRESWWRRIFKNNENCSSLCLDKVNYVSVRPPFPRFMKLYNIFSKMWSKKSRLKSFFLKLKWSRNILNFYIFINIFLNLQNLKIHTPEYFNSEIGSYSLAKLWMRYVLIYQSIQWSILEWVIIAATLLPVTARYGILAIKLCYSHRLGCYC